MSHDKTLSPEQKQPPRASRLAGLAVAFALGLMALCGPIPALAQAPAAQQPQIPDAFRLNMMIRGTLIALNHANRTGNYTVLRDLSAPGFQQVNTAARLAEIFADLRQRQIDMSPIMFFNPKLLMPASVNDKSLLRMRGYFETKPEQINFDMLFQNVAGEWRVIGLAVDVSPPRPDAAAAPAPVEQTPAAAPAPSPPAAPAPQPSPQAASPPAADVASTTLEPRTTTDRAVVRLGPVIPAPTRRPSFQPAASRAQSPGEDARAQDQPEPTAPRQRLTRPEAEFWPF